MSARGIYIMVSLTLSCVLGWAFGGMLRGSEAVLSSIIDVFAILAGVLVAVISIIGDPSMLLPGNWRVGFEHAKDIQDRIARFAHLFTVYLVAIFLAVAAQFLDAAEIPGGGWVFSLLLGVAVFGVCLSLPLPYSLMSIQKERMSDEIKRRQTQDGARKAKKGG